VPPAPRRLRYPQITDEACTTAMQLVLPDGRTLAGATRYPSASPHPRAWLARDRLRPSGGATYRAPGVRVDREKSDAAVLRALR
jgi:hypothetical protein